MARRRKSGNWIPRNLKEGALRATVRRMYGERGFTERGTIKVSVLRELARNARDRKTRERARLALAFRKMRRR